MRFLAALSSVLATAGLTSAGIISKRAVTPEQFAQFTLLEQYAAAGYCQGNDAANPGTEATCPTGNCPLVDAANTTILLSIPTYVNIHIEPLGTIQLTSPQDSYN